MSRGPQRRGDHDSFGFKLPDLNRIKDALTAEIAALCVDWRAIHGRD